MSKFRAIIGTALGLLVAATGSISALAAPVADQTQNLSPVGSFGSMCIPPGMFPNMQLNKNGSTFTAGVSGRLAKIEFPVIWTQDTADLTVNVWADSNGLPSGQPLATEVIPAANLTPISTGGTLVVAFTTPATVTSGTPYIFTFGFESCSQTVQMSVDMVNPPSDKHRISFQTGQSWAPDASRGMNFTTYVDATSGSGSGTSGSTRGGVSDSLLASTGQGQSQAMDLFAALALISTGLTLMIIRKRRQS